MENIELIISLASAAGSLLVACAAFIIKLVKNIKSKIKAEGKLAITDILTGLVETAESLDGFSGAEKLGYVLDAAASYASAKKIDFDETAAKDKIEELIQLSKLVN